MFPVLFAAAAGWIAYRYIGAKGWLILLPLIILLIASPAAGAALFLIIAGLAAASALCYILVVFLPHIIGFLIGIAFVVLLILGLGQLMGV